MKKNIVFLLAMVLAFGILLNSCGSANEQNETVVPDTEVADTAELYPIGGGEEEVCKVHNGSYHGIPGYVADRVREEYGEEFDAWEDVRWKNKLDPSENNGCNSDFTIAAVVRDFNVPVEWLETAYYDGAYYSYNWDIKSMIAGDWEAAEKYARDNVDDEAEMLHRAKEWELKLSLLDTIKNSSDENLVKYYDELTNDNTNVNMGKWSIPEFVYNTGIEKTVLENMIAHYSKDEVFDYDLDMIWREKDMLTEKMKELYPIEVDMLLHK